MTSLFFSRKSFISKITSFFTVAALTLQLLAPLTSIAHAVDAPPSMLGDYTIVFTCTTGCDGELSPHSMTIDTQDTSTGDLSGHGHSSDPHDWTMTGSVTDPDVSFDITYTESGYQIHLDGTREGDGNMSGDANDGESGNTFTWRTTSVPPQEAPKVNICHKTGSEHNPWNALQISTDAVDSHLDHGDFLYDGPVKDNGKPDTDGDEWCANNVPPETITVTATKIVCDNEADLPNWGAGLNNPPEEITADFAGAWLAQHESCHLQSGWDFQYGDQNTGYPGDTFIGPADGYTTFGTPTGEDGTTTVTIPVTGVTEVHLREIQKEGYIPFTAQTTPDNGDDVSAELYCTSDIYNYDNYEGIGAEEQTAQIIPGAHYYCVAWNVQSPQTEEPTFLKVHVYKYLKVGDMASQIINGQLGVPESFPMHSSWNAANIGMGAADYVLGDALGGAAFDYAADTSSMQAPADYTTAELTDSESGVLPIGAQCSADRFRLVGYKSGSTLEEAQAAAISDTAPVYTGITADKYVIVVNEDCDDVPPPVVDMCPNIQGDQAMVPEGYHLNDAGNCVAISVDVSPQCSDNADNDSDNLIDTLDPGCHSDGNASNSDSYVPSDNNETDESGGGGGGGSRHSSGSAGSGGSVLGASTDSLGQVLGDTMCSEYIHTYIRLGKKNDTADVIRLQAFLNTYMGARLLPTGIYNKETFDVLKAFQVKEAGQVLSPWKTTPGGINDAGTGYVFKTTKRWINLIKCPQLNLPIPSLH